MPHALITGGTSGIGKATAQLLHGRGYGVAVTGRNPDTLAHARQDLPDDVIVERMSGRRTDPETGQVYHLRYNPPPPGVADRVVQRPDDREETVRHRLTVYAEQTAPLIRHYQEAGVPIHTVDGTESIDRVQAEILNRIAH